MFRISFQLENPFFRESTGKVKTMIEYEERFWNTAHKYLSVQLDQERLTNPRDLFEFTLDVSFRGQDHAGFRLDLTIWSWTLYLNLYDSRHWDYETNDWKKYE